LADRLTEQFNCAAKLKEEREAKLARAAAKIRRLEEEAKRLETSADDQLSNARQTEADVARLEEECTTLAKAFKVKKRTLDLLPNAAENHRKLSDLVNGSVERIMRTGKQWEGVRIPLINKYRRRKQLLHERKKEVGLKVEEIKVMRVEMRRKAADLKDKARLHQQVTAELAALPKTQAREIYVRRIIDVVGTIKRQNSERDRILASVRRVQKEIANISQTQQRSFRLADDNIFQAAKREQASGVLPTEQFAGPAYRDVVTLRDGFAALISRVEASGHLKNECATLQKRIEALEQKNTTANMKTVMSDLGQVRQENETLVAQAKKLKAAWRALQQQARG
jgi:hypothetical protein